VTDEHLEKIVMYGGAAVGKSPSMPGNPDLMSKPEVVRGCAHLRSSQGEADASIHLDMSLALALRRPVPLAARG
jgi:hypothetical protein